jgi:SnoaL-like polyketide cyclase
MGWLTLTYRIFPDFHAIVEDEIAEGDRVVQRITCYGTHRGEFSGVRPTGEQVAFSSIEINRPGRMGSSSSTGPRPTCSASCTVPAWRR